MNRTGYQMNKEKPIRDQAERLRKRIEKSKEAPERTSSSKELPPRSRLHNQKSKKTKVKLKYPVIRLLVLSFILLPIVIFSVYTYNEGQKYGGVKNATIDRQGFETVALEKDKLSNESNEVEDENENEPKEDAAIDKEEDHGDHENIDGNDSSDENEEEAKENENSGSSKQNNQNSGKMDSSKKDSQKNEQGTGGETSQTVEEKVIYHKVQPNETLFRIAMNYYKSQDGIEIIRNANGIIDNEIQVGQVLKIPLKQ